mgnify:FL=1|jgi:hypothetical protein|tara:strand:+ start:320 stop:556 length:237 start_codon:yes stop_codon:yes gene_type:complete
MTKIWRKNESERIKEHLQENPGLFSFVSYMYSENTSERQSEGRTPYLNVFDYYRKHPQWLEQKYLESKNEVQRSQSAL